MSKPKQKSVTPKLRFPEFRGAGPWEVKRLGDKSVATFVRDRVPSEDIPIGHYVSTVNLLPDFGGLATEPEAPPPNNAISYQEDDILMSNIRPYLKKIWVADRSGGASNDVLVARVGESVVRAYLSCLLMSDRFIAHVMSGAKGVKMPRGDLEQIKSFEVPVPPNPNEQQKIADCLSSLDDLIQAEEAQLAALKEHKKGLMQQLFPALGETTPRLRFTEFRNDGPWEVKRLGDEEVAKFMRERIRSKDIPLGHYVSTVNLLPDFGGLSPDPQVPPLGSAIAYREDDILMSNIRPYLKKVWVADRSGGTSNDVLVVRPGKGVVRAFLGHILMSGRFILHIMDGAKGVRMPRGDLEQIQDFDVPLPHKLEQQKIADCLSSLDGLIRAKATRIEALKTHKRGLMQRLFPQEVG